MNEINLWSIFTKVRSISKKIQQASYVIAKTEDRYPAIESLTKEELDELTRFHLAIGQDIEDWYKEWKQIKKEYEDKS